MTGRGNRSVQRKSAGVLLRPPQTCQMCLLICLLFLFLGEKFSECSNSPPRCASG
jgi:hypothetical protein